MYTQVTCPERWLFLRHGNKLLSCVCKIIVPKGNHFYLAHRLLLLSCGNKLFSCARMFIITGEQIIVLYAQDDCPERWFFILFCVHKLIILWKTSYYQVCTRYVSSVVIILYVCMSWLSCGNKLLSCGNKIIVPKGNPFYLALILLSCGINLLYWKYMIIVRILGWAQDSVCEYSSSS